MSVVDLAINVLGGTLLLVSTIVGCIVGYKRIRDDGVHATLILVCGVTLIMLSGNPWQSLKTSTPWNVYAYGASLPFELALLGSVVSLIIFPAFVEALRFIARHVPSPKQ